MINELAKILPGIKFSQGNKFYWSPKEKKITYSPEQLEDEGKWALLHETGHALLDHSSYSSDYELLKMEIDAWEKAKEIALKLNLDISESHIQECLDSYRDWLFRRSICPTCGIKTIQKDNSSYYSCFNCHSNWQVSPSRFCRSYRTLRQNKDTIFI
jgi:NADH pyrophosphatase NudC (nudix superfamily)